MPSAIASKLKKNLEIVPGNNQNYGKLPFLIFLQKERTRKVITPPLRLCSNQSCSNHGNQSEEHWGLVEHPAQAQGMVQWQNRCNDRSVYHKGWRRGYFMVRYFKTQYLLYFRVV